jgi:hypothetical protein
MSPVMILNVLVLLVTCRYEEVADVSRLTTLLEDYLDEYNLSSTNALNLGGWPLTEGFCCGKCVQSMVTGS